MESMAVQRAISIRKPAARERLYFTDFHGAVLQFSFTPEDARIVIAHGNLNFFFKNGGTVTLGNFENVQNDSPPIIELSGGKTIDWREFVSILEEEQCRDCRMDLMESGVGEYQDDPGALVSPIDRLGMLGTDYWDRSTEIPEIWKEFGLIGLSGSGKPVIILAGMLVANFAMFEDGQPYQYRLADGADPATGPRDSTYEDGYDPQTGKPFTLELQGADPDVSVYAMTIGALPAASQGIVFYNGVPLQPGHVIMLPVLNAFSFKPAANFSGDVNFTFSFRLTSDRTGPATEESQATVVLHVDSVADLPETASETTGETAQGDVLTADAATFQDGWATQEVQPETTLAVTFSVTATFGDLDGSEEGWVDIYLPNGFTLPDDSPYEMLWDEGGPFFRVSIDDMEALQANGGIAEIPLTLVMDASASVNSEDNTLILRTTTHETDTRDANGHQTDDNTAIRVAEQEIPVHLFPAMLTVKAGWAYEGSKSGGNATEDLNSIGLEAGSTASPGAPLQFIAADGGVIDSVVVTLPDGLGELYLGATSLGSGPTYTLTGAQVLSNQIYFHPKPGYLDYDETPIRYVVTMRDANNNTFIVNGSTIAAIDAVADKGVISGSPTAVVEADNSTFDVAVSVTFPDVDGSERHFILVEKLDGWTCPEAHDEFTVYFDADGNALTPESVAGGEYVYNMSRMAYAKTFFRIDVTGQTEDAQGAEQTYTIRVIPTPGSVDVTINTGAMAEEIYAGLHGKEYDVANNVAFDMAEVFVNFADTTEYVTDTPAFEDHEPSKNKGTTTKSDTDGVITVRLETTNDVIDGSGGKKVVIDFEYDGPPALLGSFSYYGLSASAVSTGGNTYRLEADASLLPANSTEFSFRYNPGPYDDYDLKNIAVTLPVIATDSGQTGTVDASVDVLIVDAVADKPTGVSGVAAIPGGETAAVSGGEVSLTITAQFEDVTDGSESHFLIFDLGSGIRSINASSLPASWAAVDTDAALASAGLPAYDLSRYAVYLVPRNVLQGTSGAVNATIIVGVDEVSQDGNVTLNFAAASVDKPHDREVTASNNFASTPGSATVAVNVVTSDPKLKIATAYENDLRLDHISGGGQDGGALSVSGVDSGESLVSITIAFAENAGNLFYNGSRIGNGDSVALPGGSVLGCTASGGNFVITITGSNVRSDVAQLRFAPAENNSDLDVPLTYECVVKENGSGEEKPFAPKNATVVVDAVAQDPGDAATAISNDASLPAAYDSVNVQATASFRDVEDASEKHYLLIEAKKYFVTTGMTIVTVGFDASGAPLTRTASGTGHLVPDPGSKTDVSATPASTKKFIQIDVDDVIQAHINGDPLPAGFAVAQSGSGASAVYTVTYDAALAIDLSRVPADITNDPLVTGGMSVENAKPATGDSGGGKEAYEYNNAGYDLSEAPLSIAVVETVAVKLYMGKGYEHNSPEANEGINDTGLGAGILAVCTTPNNTLLPHEDITVAFTYDALYQDAGGEWALPGIIEYNGTPATYSVDAATGKVTATITVPAGDAASVIDASGLAADPATRAAQIEQSAIKFMPNEGVYSDKDINLSYTVQVKETLSGGTAEKGAGNGVVVIDAVADKPLVPDNGVQWDYGPDHDAFATQNATLTFPVTFPDMGVNGVQSEGHYLLIEQTTGIDLTDAFKQMVGSSLITYPKDGKLYYQIPASVFTETAPGQYAAVLPMVADSVSGDTVNYPVPEIYVQVTVKTISGSETTLDNNAVVLPITPPPLNFATANSSIAGGTANAYEGDNSLAYTGDTTHRDGGVEFSLGLTIGSSPDGQETIDPILLNYENARGDLYYTDDSGINWVYVAPGTTIDPAYANSLKFIPTDSGDDTADKDVSIGYTTTATDPASGATKPLQGDFLVIIDAVADAPTSVVADPPVYGSGESYINYNEDVTITVTADFPDFNKSSGGHADHYILVQQPGQGWSVNMPGVGTYTYKGETYFLIPVTPTSSTVSVSITLHSPSSGTLLYDNAHDVNIVGMTVDRDPNKPGSLPAGDQESQYDNNVAFTEGAPVTLTPPPPPTTCFGVGPIYENNTPDANILDANGQPTGTIQGGKVTFQNPITYTDSGGNLVTEQVTSVEVDWDPSKGSLVVNGATYTSGPVTINAADFNNVTFFANANNSDADLGTVSVQPNPGGGAPACSAVIIVDAVAQVPTDVASQPEYGDGYTAFPPDQNITVTVSADFMDTDGSEDHYVLVEAKPGWGNPMGYPVIYGPDGNAYFQVEVDNTQGHVEQEVVLTPPATGGVVGPNGTYDFTLGTGAMSVEDMSKNPVGGVDRGGEIRDDNNIAYNTGNNSVAVSISGAESNPVIHISDVYAGSDRYGEGAPDLAYSGNVYITGLNTGSDYLSQVEVTCPSAHGELEYNGVPLQDMSGVTAVDLGDGTTKLTITNQDVINALTSGNASNSAVKYVPKDYNDIDVTISGSMTVNDVFSSDSKVVGNSDQAVVDAVALTPSQGSVEVTNPDAIADGTVKSGETVNFAVTGSFPDADSTNPVTHHYLALQQVDGWEPDGPLPAGVTTQSVDGVLYYVVDVDASPTSPALTQNPDGSWTFAISLKAPTVIHDLTGAAVFQGGAMTIVEPSSGSKELEFTNNSSLVVTEIPLDIAVLETTEADFVFDPIVEDSASGSHIALSPGTQSDLASFNEKVTETDMTFSGDFSLLSPGDHAGTIIYDGKAYPVIVSDSGTATVSVDFGSAGYDSSKEFTVVWGTVATNPNGSVVYDSPGVPSVTEWNHNGSDMTVTTTSTIVDKASNESGTAPGSGQAPFVPVATAPVNFEADDPAKAVGPDSDVSFVLSASFPDYDGSESHYFMVEQKDGWTGDYPTVTYNGVTYFQIPVPANDPAPTVTVTLHTPPDDDQPGDVFLDVAALASENGTYAVSGIKQVAVKVGAVTATGVSLTMADMDEDGAPVRMQFAFQANGGDDEVTGITVTDLAGGSIVDANGATLFAATPAVLDAATALGGGYYYKPAPNASGDLNILYTSVISDPNSEANKTFAESGHIAVAPIPDAPESFATTESSAPTTGGVLYTVSLQAAFDDNDGSERHFFLVSIPDDTNPPEAWMPVTPGPLLTASGMTGAVYQIDANASGQAVAAILLPTNYPGDTIVFKAGTVETALESDASGYAFAANESTITLPPVPLFAPFMLDMPESAVLYIESLLEPENEEAFDLAAMVGDSASGLACADTALLPGNCLSGEGGYSLFANAMPCPKQYAEPNPGEHAPSLADAAALLASQALQAETEGSVEALLEQCFAACNISETHSASISSSNTFTGDLCVPVPADEAAQATRILMEFCG